MKFKSAPKMRVRIWSSLVDFDINGSFITEDKELANILANVKGVEAIKENKKVEVKKEEKKDKEVDKVEKVEEVKKITKSKKKKK